MPGRQQGREHAIWGASRTRVDIYGPARKRGDTRREEKRNTQGGRPQHRELRVSKSNLTRDKTKLGYTLNVKGGSCQSQPQAIPSDSNMGATEQPGLQEWPSSHINTCLCLLLTAASDDLATAKNDTDLPD